MIKCRICGKEHKGKSYTKPYNDICSSDCFTQNFWLEIIEEVKIDKYLHPIINGQCLCICDEDSKSSPRGYGGAQHYFTFNDGRMIASTNVWSNGIVDPRFRDYLPDNAHISTLKEIARNTQIRVYWAAKYILSGPIDFCRKGTHPSIRDTAKKLHVSVLTINVDMKKRLPKMYPKLAALMIPTLSTTRNKKNNKTIAGRYGK